MSRNNDARGWLARPSHIAALLLVFALLTLAALWLVITGTLGIPIARLPTPTGSAPVGTRLVALRGIVRGTGPTLLQVWYPSAPSAGEGPAPYLLFKDRPLRTRLIDGFVASNARLNAPLEAGRHPCLIAIAGWGGTAENNSAIAESLASHGYVVFGVGDTVDPSRPLDSTSQAALDASVTWANEKLRIATRRIARILTAIEGLGVAPGAFTAHIDCKRIGLIGFSFGGAVAAETALHDPRVRAAINMDGSMFGTALQHGVPKPFLFMLSTPPASEHDPATWSASDRYDVANRRLILAGLRKYGDGFFTLRNSGHFNYIDAALLPSIRHTGIGSVNPIRAQAAIAYYVNRFFERYLAGRDSSASDEGSAFADVVTFKVERPQS